MLLYVVRSSQASSLRMFLAAALSWGDARKRFRQRPLIQNVSQADDDSGDGGSKRQPLKRKRAIHDA